MKYKEYQTKGQLIYQKLFIGEELTEEEKKELMLILQDPLEEFCKREAPFRLYEFFGKSEEEVDEDLLEKVEEEIRNTIDYDSDIYDRMDTAIREVLSKEGE